MTDRAPAGTQAVGRALSVLKLLGSASGELSGNEIGTTLGLSSGTANRIIRALVAEDFIARNPRTDCYFLGRGAVLLGEAAQRSFGIDKMLPLLEQLNAETGESVNLSVRDGNESVVMMRVQSTLPLRFEQRPGARFPLYTTASGKAILAHTPERDAYIRDLPPQLEKLTPHTLETPQDLERALTSVRRRGYSTDEQENVDGVRCVGAPILDRSGNAQAAIVVQVPAVRMSKQRTSELGKRAAQIAAEAARFLPVDRAISR